MQTRLIAGGLRHLVHLFPGALPPILGLHGFTGSGLDFAPLAGQLERQLVCPDLVGHGGTEAPTATAEYSMSRTVARLVSLLNEMKLARLPVIGYSMGGRVALQLAFEAPERVSALVLVGATPGYKTRDERRARRFSDSLLASEILKEGVEAFADRWEALPLIASQERIEAPWRDQMKARRRANRPRGLAGSLRGMGSGKMPSLWERLRSLEVPTLLVTGEQDDKFTAIARDAVGLIPRASYSVIRDAGHSAHLERPFEVAAQIWGWLCEVEG
jgi:2-succinyl-6-hydroxy-2,4-cyclohexadiene-1-carboxylate synthase